MITLSGIDNSNTIESIRIFDASGRDCSSLIEVNKIAAADKIELDVRALASGLYQVVVRTLNPTDHYRIKNIVKQ
jgi:cell division inhibitor SulA